jgi:DNA replication protein DnaC
MCPHCEDTGWKPVTIDGVRRVERCDCWQDLQAQRLFDDARIPPRYRRCDFDSFQVYHQNEKLAGIRASSTRSPISCA